MAKEKKRIKTARIKAVSKKDRQNSRAQKLTLKQKREKTKKELGSRKPLPNSFTLTYATFLNLRRFWRPLSGVLLVYIVLNIIFVVGLIGNLRDTVSAITDGFSNSSESKFSQAFTGFSELISTNSTANDYSGAQTVLFVLGSLVFIWTLRQLFVGEKIKIKEAYYNSMAPLVPFLLVLLVIAIQLLPMVIGLVALSLVLNGFTAGSILISAGFITLFILLTTWSLYMLSSSIFAVYIVTLPNIYPLQALRSAKKLVVFRRWQIMRRIIFLPFFLLFVLGLIIIPLLMFASFLVAPVFFVLGLFFILYAHAYLYSFYKGMLS